MPVQPKPKLLQAEQATVKCKALNNPDGRRTTLEWMDPLLLQQQLLGPTLARRKGHQQRCDPSQLVALRFQARAHTRAQIKTPKRAVR